MEMVTNLDFIGIHRSIGYKDVGVLDAFGLADSDRFFEDETFLKVGFP